MYKPYKKPIIKASPDIKMKESRLSTFVVFILRILVKGYLFLFFGITKILPYKDRNLFETFERALSGKSRVIIAFRHPNGGEPQILTWFFLFRLQKYAKKYKIRFSRHPHAVFVYGYEVIRWGGWVAKFILTGVGGLPIYHSKMDKNGMTKIYKAITDGLYPVAIAPEGQVSYSADTITRLEAGTIRIGFSAAEQHEKKNPDCPVEILPLSVHFRFGSWGKITVVLLLKRIEKLCGIKRKEREASFLERLIKCRDIILETNEERYNIKTDTSLSFEERIDKIAVIALETAEQMLNIKGEGDFFARQHKVRQICWDRIFIPDLFDLEKLPRIKRSVMDLKAGEAWYIARHEELANLCWYLAKAEFPSENSPLHRKIEYTQNLHDFASRTMGGAFSHRISIFPRKVIIKTMPVINLTERLPEYKKDRKGMSAKTLADLEKAFLDNIVEMNKEEID